MTTNESRTGEGHFFGFSQSTGRIASLLRRAAEVLQALAALCPRARVQHAHAAVLVQLQAGDDLGPDQQAPIVTRTFFEFKEKPAAGRGRVCSWYLGGKFFRPA